MSATLLIATRIMLVCLLGILFPTQNIYSAAIADSLPDVLSKNRADLIDSRLKYEAYQNYAAHSIPTSKTEYDRWKQDLRKTLMLKTGITVDHALPLNYTETGNIKMNGFSIKNITYQSREGVYVTANLYVPDGKGPFPAVVNMHGHWREGRMYESVQAVAQTLAMNGYVCLSVDAFGAGERSSVHGKYEYHGNNLGASLMNVGETLLGFQVSDNMRAVDLLCSLPYVDPRRIGATGASGGGNQTMWLAAMDDRILACMPVVSVGTFEVYVMNDNCICELVPDVLTMTEESGIIALIAPRAIKMCNHHKDAIPTFLPAEMLRTFQNAKPAFDMLDAGNKIQYQLFDTTHGYFRDNRETLIGWFNQHLKGSGNGAPVKEPPLQILSDEKLMVYAAGRKNPRVENISDYCIRTGNKLRNAYLKNTAFDIAEKRNELINILRIGDALDIKKVNNYAVEDGWSKIALYTEDEKIIPVIHRVPKLSNGNMVIICDLKGKKAVSSRLTDSLERSGAEILIPDMYGTGEMASQVAEKYDDNSRFHTLSRTQLLLGRTMMGEWVKQIDVMVKYARSKTRVTKLTIYGYKEAGIAALLYAAIYGDTDLVLHDAPVSYLFDNRENVDHFSMAMHLPGILKWGDVSLAAAMTGKKVVFIDPLTMSGTVLNDERIAQFQKEFADVTRSAKQRGITVFSTNR